MRLTEAQRAALTRAPVRTCPKCGVVHQRPTGYCHGCHAAHMRAHRPKYQDLPIEAKRKSNIRAITNQAKRRGKLIQQPCERCGAEGAESHHPDYARPLDVVWLCRRHHRELHRREAMRHVKHSGMLRLLAGPSPILPIPAQDARPDPGGKPPPRC